MQALSLTAPPQHVTSIDCILPPIDISNVAPLPPVPIPAPIGTLTSLILGIGSGGDGGRGGLPPGSTLTLATRFQKEISDLLGGRTRGEIVGRVRSSFGIPSLDGGETRAGIQAWARGDTEGGGEAHVSVLAHPTMRLYLHLLQADRGGVFGKEGGRGRLADLWEKFKGGMGADYSNGQLTATAVKGIHSAKTHLFGMLTGPGGFSAGVKGAVSVSGRRGTRFDVPSAVVQYSSDTLELSSIFSQDMEDFCLSFSHLPADHLTIAGEINQEKGKHRENKVAVAFKNQAGAKLRGIFSDSGNQALEYVMTASPQLRYRACATMGITVSGGVLRVNGPPNLSLSITATS